MTSKTTPRLMDGFILPKQNWSKLPHILFDYISQMTGAELKIVLYILRHTWGFSEFGQPKRITLDEFCNGRKRADGSRMDIGTGLSPNSIKTGIRAAIAHGFLLQIPDNHDAARHSYEYQLNMIAGDESSKVDARVSKIDTQPSKTDTRSEKETIERNEERKLQQQAQKPQLSTSLPVDQSDWDEQDHANFDIVLESWVQEFGKLTVPEIARMIGLWNEYPELEIHEYAWNEMIDAKARRGVRPNLAYYEKCLATECRQNWIERKGGDNEH